MRTTRLSHTGARRFVVFWWCLALLTLVRAHAAPGGQPTPPLPPPQGDTFTFVSYNVANFSPLPEPGRAKPGKSAKSTAALIATITELAPDILGVCEMGPPRQFEAFRQMLTAAGLDYPYAEYVDAADPDRHLALVSRFPIIARASRDDIAFDAGGNHEKVRRGFLDVTVRIRDGVELRLVGVHLKSRLPTREGEALLRRLETNALRAHLDAVLAAHPTQPLLLYGDFNETRDQPNIRQLSGVRGGPDALTPLPLADAQGDRWTYYWKQADLRVASIKKDTGE